MATNLDPKISVITITKDRAVFIQKAVESGWCSGLRGVGKPRPHGRKQGAAMSQAITWAVGQTILDDYVKRAKEKNLPGEALLRDIQAELAKAQTPPVAK